MVVDKVDKPEAPPAYRIEATVETKGQKHQRQQEEKREEDEYNETANLKGWQKFHTEAKNRRSLKFRVKDISKIFYNQVFLQKGIVIIDTNIELINGKLLRHAYMFASHIDTYWKLKKLKTGDQIQKESIIAGDYVEISIYQKDWSTKKDQDELTASGRIVLKKKEEPLTWSLLPLYNSKTDKFNWVSIALFGIVIISVLIVIIMLI